MKNLKKNLQAVAKELKALIKKTEIIIREIDKLGKSQPAKKPKSKIVRAKITKKAPVKKKSKTLTDTDKVINIIKKSKKGVAVSVLRKKTGFGDKKISNIVFRATKNGKIKKAGIGIYMAT